MLIIVQVNDSCAIFLQTKILQQSCGTQEETTSEASDRDSVEVTAAARGSGASGRASSGSGRTTSRTSGGGGRASS